MLCLVTHRELVQHQLLHMATRHTPLRMSKCSSRKAAHTRTSSMMRKQQPFHFQWILWPTLQIWCSDLGLFMSIKLTCLCTRAITCRASAVPSCNASTLQMVQLKLCHTADLLRSCQLVHRGRSSRGPSQSSRRTGVVIKKRMISAPLALILLLCRTRRKQDLLSKVICQ